jgi:DNA repair exonuclease SbcCD nuclease subunit
MTIRFLHVADLHLGLRITRFEENACNRIGEARFMAIERLKAKAAEHQVAFILIAGDVFDDPSVPKTTSDRAFALFESGSMPCPVFIIPGNHDPLTPGGVWDRDPWNRTIPPKRVHVLRESRPVAVPGLPVTIFPCPLRHRNSIEDPTAWIASHPRVEGDHTFRIGLAHGSLRILPQLPEDDHLIRHDATDRYGLDYLALGHWHKPLRHKSADGAERTAYSGTHEPMRFPDTPTQVSTGWSAYSTDGDAERFVDAGCGVALLVTIDEPATRPTFQEIAVSQLRWVSEHRDITGKFLGELISEFAKRDGPEKILLRLTISGVTDPMTHARLDNELFPIIRDRYHSGSRLDTDAVLIELEPTKLRDLVGDGVLARVLQRLQEDRQSTNEQAKRMAEHALKVLYRIAWEVQNV